MSLRRIGKTFAATKVLRDVDLDIRRGEVHALLGGNGSGKSTLIKLLAGVYRADHGAVIGVHDRQHRGEDWNPGIAKSEGLHFVHQDPAVFGDLSVAENLAIGGGFERTKYGRVKWRDANRQAAHVLARFGLDVDPTARVASLRPAARTMLAVARALQGDHDEASPRSILVLDEPTASLPAAEVDLLLSSLRERAAEGQTILYVSHRLDEILDIAERVTVLRDGGLVQTRSILGLDERQLVELMVGKRPTMVLSRGKPAPTTPVALSIRGLRAGPLQGIDFTVQKGEVLGVAGLLGSGRSELLRAIFGDLPCAGTFEVDGQPYKPRSPATAIRAGIAFVPEDRKSDALFSDLSVRQNLSTSDLRSYWRLLRLRHGAEHRDAVGLVKRFDVQPSSDAPPAGRLSGGNQQKVVLARWLRSKPSVLLLDEPTQGVDVGARAAIYGHVREEADRGMAVVLVTSDFNEMAQVADRVIVLRSGKVVAEVVAPHIDPQVLTQHSYLSGELSA